MIKKTCPDEKANKTQAKAMKSRRDSALEELRDCLRLLVACQKNSVAQAKLTKKCEKHDQDRLALYDRFIPLLVKCFEELDNVLAEKQPGGRPPHALRDVAFDILTSYHLEKKDVPQAKVLIKKMEEKLQINKFSSDASGTEQFSVKQAYKAIRDFKELQNNIKNTEN